MDQSACNLQSLYVPFAAFAVAAFATFFQFRAMKSQLSVMQKSIDLG